MSKVAIYARVSTEEQNIDQQRDLLIDWCKRNNHTFRSYMDKAMSGKVSDRPQWKKLLNDCENGEFDILCVARFDRITRDLGYSIQFLDWLRPLLEQKKVRLVSLYDGEFEFTPDHIFMFKMKCLLSEYELDMIRWRTRIGVARAQAEGKYTGGKVGRKWKK